MCPRGTRPGILYGLPKVHKTVVNRKTKLRPILSTINTPTYKLSKFLVPLLSPITKNEFTINNTFSFAKEVKDFDPSLYMSSLDIDSLFTNIPLEETIDICVKNLYEGREIIDGISIDMFREFLTVALSNSCFIFDGELYCQTDGVSMGSPLGPHLANAFLCHHEKTWIDNCPSDIKPLFLPTYILQILDCKWQSDFPIKEKY